MSAPNFPLDPVSRQIYQASTPVPKKGILRLQSLENKSIKHEKQKRKIDFQNSVDDAFRNKLSEKGLSKKKIERKMQKLKSGGISRELEEMSHLNEVQAQVVKSLLNNMTDLIKRKIGSFDFNDSVLEQLKLLALQREDSIEVIDSLKDRINTLEIEAENVCGHAKTRIENKIIKLQNDLDNEREKVVNINLTFRDKYYREGLTLQEAENEIKNSINDRDKFKNQFAKTLIVLENLKNTPPSDEKNQAILKLKKENAWFNTLMNKMLMFSKTTFQDAAKTEDERIVALTQIWLNTPVFDEDLKNAKKELGF